MTGKRSKAQLCSEIINSRKYASDKITANVEVLISKYDIMLAKS